MAEHQLDMVDRQETHRQKLESASIFGDLWQSRVGLVCGTVVTLAIVGCGTWLGSTGHDTLGGTLIGINIVGTLAVFIYGTRSRRAERKEKTQVMAGLMRQEDQDARSQQGQRHRDGSKRRRR